LRVSGRFIPPFIGNAPELNFAGQTRGWAKYMEQWLIYLDGLTGNGWIEGGGWVTVFDLDFTAQPAASFATDGPYTIAGLTWTKAFSSQDLGGMHIAAGGLVINPKTTAAWNSGGVHQAPMLQLPLTSIPALGAALDWSSQLRIWVYYSSVVVSGDNDQAIAALSFLESVPANHALANDYVGFYGKDSTATIGSQVAFFFGNAISTPYSTAFALASYPVNVIEAGCNASIIKNYYAASSGNAWPSAQALNLGDWNLYPTGSQNRGTLNINWPGPQGPLSAMCLTLAGQGPSGLMVATISRIRIDIR
jgi:hypothetical protein